MLEREEVLIVTWLKLPEPMREYIKNVQDWRFRNDIIIEWGSELQPVADQSYSDTLTPNAISEYWRDQTENNGYVGGLDAFIRDYGLVFEEWLINQEFDLTGIRKILIDIMW